MEQMSKVVYIRILRKKLQGMNETDIEDAIHFVEEYFDEAGEGNEQNVLNDLGTPTKFAATMKADNVSKNVSDDQNVNHKRTRYDMKKVLTIFIGICALPIALPLLIAVFCLMIAFIIVMIAVFITGIFGLFGCFAAGVPLIIRGLFLFNTLPDALVSIGSGLIALGLGLLLFIGSYQLIKTLVPLFGYKLTSLYKRTKEKGEKPYEKN